MCNYIFLPVQRLGRKPKDQDTAKMFLENNNNKIKVFIDKNSLHKQMCNNLHGNKMNGKQVLITIKKASIKKNCFKMTLSRH